MMHAHMATTTGERTQVALADPLLGLSCAVAIVVYLLHGFDGVLTRDVAVYTYGGQQVAEGVAPYVSILNRAGPLAHLIPGVAATVSRAVGFDDILGIRVLFMLISIACVGLVYLLGRDLFRSRLAGLATAAALLCFHGFIQYATYGPREKTAMVMFLLAALLAMAHQRWLTTGVFVALGTLTWQPVFFAAIAGIVVAVLLGVPTGRLKALGRVAVGGLVPSLLTVGAYAVTGHLRVFLDDFVLINARYTHQRSMLDKGGARSWDNMIVGYGWSTWVIVVGSVALIVLTVVALAQREGRRDPLTAGLVGAGVAFLAGLLWSVRAFDSWPDAFVLLPGAALGIGGIAALVRQWVRARAAVAATLAWAVATTAMSASFALDTRNDVLDDQRESVDTVLGVLPPGSRILSIEAPQPLALAHMRNLSRYQLFGNGLIDYLEDTWPGGVQGYADWIAHRKPTLIAAGGGQLPEWLAPTLEGDYRRIGRVPGWAWYVRLDVGPPTLLALGRALDDQSWRVKG